MKKYISLFLFALLFFACESNKELIIHNDNLLIGNWVNPSHEDEKVTYTRSNSTPNEAYSIQFKKNSDFIERTSGFCGTPPLTFFNVEGTYQLKEDIITVSSNYYSTTIAWRILELTDTKLVLKKELTPQEKDHRKLMQMFDEFYNLAYNTSCKDASNWAFTSYGAKACGGPQGYIPYSTTIDTKVFLEKVEAYKEAEKNYNIKWSIASTCDVPQVPKKVECNNGYPILIYQ